MKPRGMQCSRNTSQCGTNNLLHLTSFKNFYFAGKDVVHDFNAMFETPKATLKLALFTQKISHTPVQFELTFKTKQITYHSIF